MKTIIQKNRFFSILLRNIILPVFILLLFLSVSHAQDSTHVVTVQSPSNGYDAGKIYFKLKNSVVLKAERKMSQEADIKNFPFLQEIRVKYSLTQLTRPFFHTSSDVLQRTFLLMLGNDEDTEQVIEELVATGEVEYAEKAQVAYVDEVTYTPNDPQMAANQWYLTKIKAFSAWDYTKGDKKIVVAPVEDAVSTKETDLKENIWINADEIAGNNVDDDGNGFIDDVNGWDVGDADNNPDPPAVASWQHGTHVAGCAGATTDNGFGIASIGFNISIMPIKCGKNSGSAGALYNMYEGVTYAIDNGADVINMSWGVGFSQTGQNVMDYGYSKGVVFTSSAGNSNNSAAHYPSDFNHVISVAATDENDKKASFSNYSSTVDLSAPGVNIWNLIPTNQIALKSGTSHAAPMVAGLAALMLSLNGNLTPDQVESCLKSSAININSLNSAYSGKLGAGRIDAEAAIKCAASFTGITDAVSGEYQLLLFPNPADEQLAIMIRVKKIKNGTITIRNILGEEIFLQNNFLANDSSAIYIDVSSFSSGIYFVTVETEDASWTRKFNKK